MSTLDESLALSLEATLSPDLSTRSQAEAHLVELHQNAQTGLALCSLVLGSPTPRAPHVRQAAALSLRRWITERWSPYHNSFVGFAPKGEALSIELKAPIRGALIQALALPERQLRLAAAYALSAASAPDWPDDAPELIPSVKALLEGANDDAVHGAMCFLSEFVQNDLDENQIMSVSRELLPNLERLLGESQRYAASLRARALLVFRHLLETLFMVRESYPEASKQAAQDVLPRWLAALQGIVSGDVGATLLPGASAAAWEELGLKDQAWKTLSVATHFRTHLKPYLGSFVSIGLGSLQSLNAAYATYYVQSNDDTPDVPEASEGDSSVSSTIPNLASQILQFLTESLRSEPARQTLIADAEANGGTPPALASLVNSLRLFSRMTRDDEEEWGADASAFVAASDDEEGLGFGLRGACADVLANLLEEHARPALACLQGLAHTAASEAAALKSAGSKDAWKEEEATLALLGGVAEAVREHLPEAGEQGPFDLGAVFAQLVLPNMGAKTYPFLFGRCFVFASQYAAALPTELSQQILQMAVSAIEDESSEGEEGDVVIKLSAVRCLKNFYRHLPASQTQPFASRIIARLGPLLAVATTTTLVLILETLQLVTSESLRGAGAPADVSPQVFGEIIGATLLAWAKDAKDHVLLAVVGDLLEALAATKSAPHAAAVVQRALGTLVEALASGAVGPAGEPDDVLVSGSVDLIGSVLRGAEGEILASTRAQDILMGPVMGAIMKSEDRDVLQNGVDYLTLLVRKIPEATLSWTDPSGTTAIASMLAIVAKLLQQNDELESGGLAVGDLIIALLRKAPQAILSVLPDLLTALANRLVNVKTATFAQSLILPFAYIMLEQSSTVLDHLETVQVPLPADSPLREGGRESISGLEILARRWVENAETFQGFWAQRVSSIALSKLLEASRASLESVVVQGDMLPDDSNVIRTRSRAKTMPHRFTQIPLPAKMLKLLLVDWEHARRGPPGPTAEELAEGARTPETDDEDGEWDDEVEPRKKNDQFLSDLLGPGGLGGLDEDGGFDLNGPEDADLASDEVYNMDAKTYLASFLATQVQRPDANARFAPYLSAEEQQKMTQAVSGK